MGLDWMVQTDPNGVEPMEVAGALKLDRNNQASVEAFREFYENNRKHSMGGIWQQPFSNVLDLYEGHYLPHTIPRDFPGRASVSGMLASSLDFRGKLIAYIEALPDWLVAACYTDMSGDEACDLADNLEAWIGSLEDPKVLSKEDRDDLDAGIKWLRFWGGRGHPIVAWY